MSISDYADAPTFTGMTLDRVMDEREDPVTVAQLREDPAARAVAASGDGVLLGDGDQPTLLRIPIDSRSDPILLGRENGAALFATDLESLSDSDRAAVTDAGRIASLRDAGAVVSRPEAGLAAYLTALLNWHRRHRFCANCGFETEVREGGYSRHCPRCGANHFPRTDPVVIMTVEYDDRLLLGHRAGWPERRYSVLAGFVAPGEAAEEAVVREVAEESGIVARDPRFVSSQPWPFPSSLMLGFEAQADGGTPRTCDGELDAVRWFTREEVQAGVEGTHPDLLLPPGVSIARFLIDRWLARPAA
jgi:NAD+ diphosphatase